MSIRLRLRPATDEAGDRARFVAGDAMVQADVEGFVDATVEAFGTIDVLVNNAGGAGDLQPRELDESGNSGSAIASVVAGFARVARLETRACKVGCARVFVDSVHGASEGCDADHVPAHERDIDRT